MSDSLIAFQPAIEGAVEHRAFRKISSSIMLMSKVTSGHLPRGSVKRRSTYFTSLSLIDFRTVFGGLHEYPFWLTGRFPGFLRQRHFRNDL